jgi:hypothetical protein
VEFWNYFDGDANPLLGQKYSKNPEADLLLLVRIRVWDLRLGLSGGYIFDDMCFISLREFHLAPTKLKSDCKLTKNTSVAAICRTLLA